MRKAVWVLGLLIALSLHASSPDLVFDIYRGDDVRNSDPRDFFSTGRAAYFFANDGSGSELWITDGTTEGTRMVAELTPGDTGDAATGEEGFVASGDLVWFWYADPFDDDELALWRTDGTREGTFAVARNLGSYAGDLAPIGARGVVARSSDRFLSSDGTIEGTRFVKGDLFPQQLVSFRGLVYFIHERELWRTDGTEAGTSLVGGFDEDFGDLRDMVGGQDAIYILADSQMSWEPYYLWRSDGAQPQRVATFLKHPNDAPRLIETDGAVYALVGVEEKLTEIWRLGAPPVRVTVIEGHAESYMFLEASGGAIYFETEEPEKLWRSDGTAGGTRVFEGVDVRSGELFLARSRVFLFSGDGVHVSDGTRTTKVTPHESRPYDYAAAVVGDLVVLTLIDPEHGAELWVSDGTPQGTRLLKNIRADGGSEGAHLRRLGDELLFSAKTEHEGYEPWITDGTLFGTRLLADISRGPYSSFPILITPLAGGRTVFLAAGRLYATDGNLTEMLRQDVIYFNDDVSAGQLPVIDGRAWVVYSNGTSDEVWATDGTRGGTVKLVDVPYGDRDFAPLAANGVLFFVARRALWRTDGTDAGTFAVASFPEQMHAVGNRLFFLSRTAAHGRELWVTDGTLGGTHIVRDIHRGEEDAFPFEYPYDRKLVVMQSAGNLLFFVADDGVHGQEPWRSDGTEAGTFLLRDIAPGAASSMLSMFDRDASAFADGSLFFGADDGVHGHELWRSDLRQTTELVRDISRGRGSSAPTHFRAIGDLVYLSADDGRHGRELWWATPANAGLLADVNPGPDSSLPREMTELHGSVYFFATTEATGDELWRADPPRVARRRSVR